MSAWKSWNPEAVKAAVMQRHEKAVRSTLHVIGEQAQAEVPLDEGTLQKSLFIDFIDGVGVISFGGGAGTPHPLVPYAKRWHENTANFQRGRKSQYLRDPFNKLARPTYDAFIAKDKL